MVPSRYKKWIWGLLGGVLFMFAFLGSRTFTHHSLILYSRGLNYTQSNTEAVFRGTTTESVFKGTTTESVFRRTTRPNFSQKEIKTLNQLLQPQHTDAINCSMLFRGDKNETQKAVSLQKKNPYKAVAESVFINATRNCDLYRLARKYVTDVSEEERAFPLAYSIVIHKSIEQFERSLRAIYRPNNYYCVHVDKKVSPVYMAAVKGIVDCFDNVFIASKLEVVVYAGFTRLQADINCMRELRENFTDWKYVLNLAGTEMPLKTNLEMVQHLRGYKGLNIVGKNMKSLNTWRWQNTYATVVTGNSGVIKKINNTNAPPPYKLNMTKGSAYAILSRPMIDHILTDQIPRAFLEWCKSTYSPDEHFWATLNNLYDNPGLRTPGGNACPDTNYMWRAVLWYSPNCHGINVRSICVFGAGDLPWIGKRPEFILNKLDLWTDYIAYQCVEELLIKRDKKKEKIPWDIESHRKYIDNYNATACRTKG